MCSEAYNGDMKTIRCVGDSITEGWGLPDPQSQCFPGLLSRRFPDLQFHNFGSAGAAVQSFLPNAYQNTLAYQVSRRDPADLTLIFLGTNDAEQLTPSFVEEYRALLKQYPGEKLLVIPPKTAIPALNRRMERIRQDILETGLPVVDLYPEDIELSADGVHPTVHGQEQIARIVGNRLQEGKRQTPPDCL